MSTGLPLVAALAEFGVIVWLLLGRRNDRRKITNLTLRARRAELRIGPDPVQIMLKLDEQRVADTALALSVPEQEAREYLRTGVLRHSEHPHQPKGAK